MKLLGTLFVGAIIVLCVEAGVIQPSGILDISMGFFTGAFEGGTEAVQEWKEDQ